MSDFLSFLSPVAKMASKTPPHWVEDQKSLLQMLCQQVEALKVRINDEKTNLTLTFIFYFFFKIFFCFRTKLLQFMSA